MKIYDGQDLMTRAQHNLHRRRREREREREVLHGPARRLLALLLSALAHQMRSASALECVCESSLTTDPPNHYHRNLIQTILSPFFIVYVCVCYLASSIHFLTIISSPKMCLNLPIKFCSHKILVSSTTDYFYAFTGTHTHKLYKHTFTLIRTLTLIVF